MTLGRMFAYCLTCTDVRAFAGGHEDSRVGAMIVRTGQCHVCSANMVRLLPFSAVPEVGLMMTRDTYQAQRSDPRTYVCGHYTGTSYRWVEGTYVTRETPAEPIVRGQRRHIDVAELLRTVKGSVDIYGQREDGLARWEAMVANKAAAGHFDNIVDTIAREGMQLSIVLWDRYGSGDLSIGNGHHRLVACILLGIERIPVIVSRDGDYMCVDDSSDDEDRPIERDTGGERMLWPLIKNKIAKDADQLREEAAEVERLARIEARRQERLAYEALSTQERVAQDAAKAAKAAAQAAAGDAVWKLRNEQQVRMREAQEKAADLRAQAEALDAVAAEAEAMFAALIPYYYAAAELEGKQ